MAQLQKGTTYITGDQVTAANLNALVDSGILTPGAVTDQTAKTVPLAADTILLHSAADTALRKTTMTQLFATPQPLGATTPSSIAATTGTFSSTLGVTGVATLGNGAILGTPASGTVTNLTGTASININGTVGATTPSTIAATTISATGIISSTSNNPSAEFGKGNGTAASVRLNPHTATYYNWSIDNGVTSSGTLNIAPSTAVGGNTYTTPVAIFTTTGLNSTAIGATTPSTGAFTTAGVGAAATSGTLHVTSSGGAFGDYQLALTRTSVGTTTLRVGGSNELIIAPNGTDRASFTTTGAAITGTLSATGAISGTANGSAFSFTPTTQSSSSYITWNNTGGTSYLGVESSAGGNIITGSTAYGLSLCSATSRDLFLGVNAGTKIAQLSTTGLAVTGTLSSSSADVALTTQGNLNISTTNTAATGVGGTIILGGASSATYAAIKGVSDSGYYSGALILATKLSATGIMTEAMRINHNGNVGIGTASALGGKLNVSTSDTSWAGWLQQTQGAGSSVLLVEYSAAAPNTTTDYFGLFRDTAGQKIQLRSNGGIGNFSANDVNLSDERLKKDIIAADSYLDKMCAIEVVKFKYKDQTHNDYNLGVIAQQVEAVAPEFVDVDGFDSSSTEEIPLKAIYQTDLSYGILKAVQELAEENKSLRKRLAALESK